MEVVNTSIELKYIGDVKIEQTDKNYTDQAFGSVNNISNIQIMYASHGPKLGKYRFAAHYNVTKLTRKIKIR